MGVVNRAINAVRKWWNGLFSIKDIETAFDVTIATPPDLLERQETWRAAVAGTLPHNAKIPSMYRAALLSSKISKIVTLEENVTISGSDVADFINEQILNFRKNLTSGFRQGVEKCCNGGKVLSFLEQLNDRIDILIYENNEYYPIEYDRRGTLIDVIIAYSITQENDNNFYTLLGRFSYDEQAQQMYVSYRAFRSADENVLGREIALSSVEEWAKLPEEIIYNFQEASWFLEISMPKGEALFSKAIDLFRDLDELWVDAMDEFKKAKSKVIMPVEYMKYDERNEKLIDPKSDLYIFHDTDGKEITIYNPPIRVKEYLEGLNSIQRQIENACEVAYGTISDPAQQARTATEILSSKDVTFTTIADTQTIWETALRKIAVAMRSIAVSFLGYSYGELKFVFDWNDGVPVDEKEEAELTKGIAGLLQLNADIIRPEERRAYLMKRIPDLAGLTDEELSAAEGALSGVGEETE